MVISHIFGGLGNQLFQYAAGRYIADKYNVPLKLDISAFKNSHTRNFDLDKFDTRFTTASDQEIKSLKPGGNLTKALQYLWPKDKRTYHRERFFHYDKRFEKIGPSVYLKGYFQSEKYFTPVADIIRKEYTVDKKYTSRVSSLVSVLNTEASVSVHIRRGDYINPQRSAIHAVLPLNYYSTAIGLIHQKVSSPSFYFFSDDIEWTKENLPMKNATYISEIHSSNHQEDFYLMSRCHHNIIANSSFSWWPAWLNTNPDKIVIAPKNWFADSRINTNDLIPADWIRI